MIRRCANAIWGSGPWRVASFEEIARDHASDAAGIHHPEKFSGLLYVEPGESAEYAAGPSLFGDEQEWEPLPDGPRYRSCGIIPPWPRRVFSLSDAGVITPDGVVYCRHSRRAVRETAEQWTQPAAAHPVLGAVGYPAPRRLPGLTLSLLTLSGEGYYHFLLESIPRLHLLWPWLQQADHLLVAGTPGGLQEHWLEHAGIPLGKIVWMSGLCHVDCEQLLFTSRPMADQRPSRGTLAMLRARLGFQPAPNPQRRIWISRRDAAHRHLAAEDRLLALLPGFERVELSRLSPQAQISLLGECAVIAGPHGAGLANVVFGPPGAHVFEIFPPDRRQPIYQRLAHLADQKYHWAAGSFTHPEQVEKLAAGICHALS